LKPHQIIEGGIKNNYVLTKETALLLRAAGEGENAGGQWMVQGPCKYAPPVEAEVIEERKAIILEMNQGIYVRDLEKGDVKIVRDHTYMLSKNEVLVEKTFESRLEQLIDPTGTRDKTRAVTITLQQNEAIHIYKEKDSSSRVVLGPDIVMLEYDEHVTINILSGKTPKEEGIIKTLQIKLGPDFMSDIFKVETSNSAKLRIQLSYNWHFKIDKND
jgi:major vault protein